VPGAQARLAQACLVSALAGLVLGERLGRVDVAERRVRRDERRCGRDVQPVREHRRERRHLHLAESRQRLEPGLELRRRRGAGPDARGVAVVALRDVGGEVAHALGHRARETVDRRPLAEDRFEVHRGERGGLERADALADHERTHERLLHRDLLVEREADQQRERIANEELVRLVGIGEVQLVVHRTIVMGAATCREAAAAPIRAYALVVACPAAAGSLSGKTITGRTSTEP
jgi:hypothetical protein